MPCPPREAFQIGWICALPIEAAAAREMLDEIFDILDFNDTTDLNTYTLGRIGKHNVVIACLPTGQYGTTLATTVANNMVRMFSRSLRIGLIVGIGAGIPSATHDIRLGDIVISYPEGTCGGVLQYDLGKVGVGGVFRRTGSLNSPPRSLLAAVRMMRAAELTDDPRYPEYLISAMGRTARTRKNFARPDAQYDRLFKLEHDHPPTASSCDTCLPEWEEIRTKREDNNPQSHYGIVASGNAVIKNPRTREQLRLETGALCFEMEAAGLMSDFPCIIIRGICDYADSHKNKQWQGYAALAAASYAKELLGYVPEGHVLQENLVVEVYNKLQEEIEGVNKRLNRAYDQQEQHHNERGNPPNVDYENKDDTNSSDVGDQTDVESIFSTESISSWESEITSTAISELARLLLNDDQLMGLYSTAISKVGSERFQRNFSHRNADGDESSVDSDPSDSESTTLATLEKVKEFLVSTHAFLNLRHEFQQWLEGKKRDGHGTQSEKKDTDYLSIQDGCQVMEARKQVLAPEHSDTPDLSSGAVGHDMQPLPDFVDFGDSDSSNENDSVFSAPVSPFPAPNHWNLEEK
ncbi:hypothetical protein N7444_009783 [Penicillium canescens]|nr:hypothetical protein N7444_009783 [Penicillium canescens]